MLQNKPIVHFAIVDDHTLIIEGVLKLLANQKNIRIAGTFTSGMSFLSFLRSNPVTLVLLDITLPDINGIDLCKEIKKISPDTLVLALSNHSERSMIMQMLQYGASGYLLKNVLSRELISCIDNALSGEVTFSSTVKEILARPSLNDLKPAPQLTRREKQILQFIAAGKTTAEIAQELHLSSMTIDTHRRNLMQKFEVKNSPALIKAAVENGFM